MSAPPAPPNDLVVRRLILLGLMSWGAYLCVTFSSQSLHVEGSGGHSLLTLLALFALAFGCYLGAIRAIADATPNPVSLRVIIAFAVLFRLTMLFSDPIEEIDLYRYLWDGAAVTQGVDPYRYTPQQVLAHHAGDDLPGDLARLVRLREGHAEWDEILKRVHFGELPTIYPPISQFVFALAHRTTPDDASVPVRLFVMRAWFVLLDVATIGVVLWLLRICGHPPARVIVYAWCPLLIKEISNSGHLDALAIFLSAASAACLASAVCFRDVPHRHGAGGGLAWSLGAALLLALAVGAKLYPLVLAPLWLLTLWHRLGGRIAAGFLAVFGSVLVGVLWPMVPRAGLAPLPDTNQLAVRDADEPPLPPMEVPTTKQDPSRSLRAFLSEWEMNDLLFLLVVENVRPDDPADPGSPAWFRVIPDRWRREIVDRFQSRFSVDRQRAPFFLARLAVGALLLTIAGALAWRNSDFVSPEVWLRAAFLTLAWFWLLLPTGNPWYWLWCLPFLPFATNRGWLLMGGVVFLYYLRFWLAFHFADRPVLGTPYFGPAFFDYVVVWIEFCPVLAAVWLQSRRSVRPTSLHGELSAVKKGESIGLHLWLI